MNIEKAVLENLRALSLEQQQQVLDFSEFLKFRKTILSSQEKRQRWLDMVANIPQTSANLPDEALHRDSMYEDRS